MKKAKANVTLKIRGKLWVRGTIFLPPYPDGVQCEIDANQGRPNPTITEFGNPDPVVPKKPPEPPEASAAPVVPEASISEDGDASTDTASDASEIEAGGESHEKPVETDAEKKKRLLEYARHQYGVKIDGRKGVDDIEAQIAVLESDGNSDGSKEEADLNSI